MLSKEEKRFIRYWQDQRSDGRMKYYLLYVLTGTFIVSIFIFIALFFAFHISVSVFLLIIVPIISIFVTLILTHIGWTMNENKWKRLIKREIDQGRLVDEEAIAP